jgi:hypothetical protein
MRSFKKLFSLLDHDQQRRAGGLLVLMLIGMVLETMGGG